MTLNNQDKATPNANETHEWKFQTGDIVRASGKFPDGEKWEEFLIIIGRIWSDKGAATHFEGSEDRITPGRNYFCKLIDDRQYTGFYPEATINLVIRGDYNAA